jgi:hypothetical protein
MGAPSRAYRRYTLGLLTAVYIPNYVDRQILAPSRESSRDEPAAGGEPRRPVR